MGCVSILFVIYYSNYGSKGIYFIFLLKSIFISALLHKYFSIVIDDTEFMSHCFLQFIQQFVLHLHITHVMCYSRKPKRQAKLPVSNY